MNVKRYSLPADLLQAVTNILTARPWAEVNNVVSGILQETQAQDAQVAEDEKAAAVKAAAAALPAIDKQALDQPTTLSKESRK